MRIGVPKEIKSHEYRVGLSPAGVRELVVRGHAVVVERTAGAGAGFGDPAYAAAGAMLVDTAAEVFARAELIVKVKEPQASEIALLRPDHTLFAYLHLAPDAPQTRGLVESGAVAIAYEAVTAPDGSLPLLAPMSEVAGRMSIQVGATCLERPHGGAGILLGGVPGVAPGRVTVLGAGVVGVNAARMAVGLGAEVTIVNRSADALRRIDAQFGNRVRTLLATAEAIEGAVAEADLVVGAVLVRAAAAPRLVSRELLRRMRAGSVVVDVAIDQGGCFETSRPTTHAAPTFVVDGIVHYCVANMPGAVPRTATFALTGATLPYVLALADQGPRQALLADPGLCEGLSVHRGEVTSAPVAEALGYRHVAPRASLARSDGI